MPRERTFYLKNRMNVPPRGFILDCNGRKCRSNFFKEVARESGLSAEEADRLISKVLYDKGYTDLVNEFIPAMKDQGVGEVIAIDSERLNRKSTVGDTFFFNPAICKYEGKILMAYRRNLGNADICLCELDPKTWQPVDGTCQELDLPKKDGAPSNSWEDPRLYCFDGKLMMSYGHWGHDWVEHRPTQHFCLLERKKGKFKVGEDFIPNYGLNGKDTEKNWLAFQDLEGKLWVIYNANPHITFGLNHEGMERSDWKHEGWKNGLRGGTPPVLNPQDGLLYTFVRSHDDTGNRGAYHYQTRRYTVGCYAFEPIAPFKVVKYCPEPLLTASEEDDFLPSAPSVCFSSGCIWHEDQFVVSLGVHDKWCAIWKVDMEVLNKEMVNV